MWVMNPWYTWLARPIFYFWYWDFQFFDFKVTKNQGRNKSRVCSSKVSISGHRETLFFLYLYIVDICFLLLCVIRKLVCVKTEIADKFWRPSIFREYCSSLALSGLSDTFCVFLHLEIKGQQLINHGYI